MESSGGNSGSTMTAAAAMPSPSVVADGSKVFCSTLFKATNYEFDPSISEEERRFYLKAYPTVDVVRERKTHCTVCKIHIGTAPVQETGIKMHPILRVTHCNKCHDFYNSGEFSKGEDGSELYCRWCGQGGEVYCCSSCPYVFCKSCIVKNLSRGVVADIEQNENWNCFSCAPKILWPLRAQHWALMNYIESQKKELYSANLSEAELKLNLGKDRSRCCRLAKSKCGNMSDSMESLDSVASKRSHASSSYSGKKPMKHSATPSPQHMPGAKRAKNNDEVVCTPDLLSMLEPDCQITVSQKNRTLPTPSASTPKIMSIQQPQAGYSSMTSTPKSSAPPPLVLRNTAIKLRPAAPPPVVRRTIIGPRTPNPGGNGTPVYHTINGYRIDLNSAAQQETFRLPNGKLIQVKRQGPPNPQNPSPASNNWQQMSSPQPQRVIPQTIASRPVQITQHPYNISVQQQMGQHPQVVRYHNSMIGSTTINQVSHNGTTIQVVNGQMPSGPQQHAAQQQQQQVQASGPIRPVMVRHVFPDNPIGQARTGLQDQVFNAMEICTHLTNKVQTLTNSNAYKQARNFLEVKELYIHLSYLLTYAIGRFKSLQDKCLGDMRTLGFGNDADCLENGQLAADKQASDDEDNEIEIVEPKTDLITLDSDDDEPAANGSPNKAQPTVGQIKIQQTHSSSPVDVKMKLGQTTLQTKVTAANTSAGGEENMDLMSMAQSFLASMLEVDVQECQLNSPGSDSSGQKKQPRKKLTSKPNPTLIKQKALMERERLEEMKRNDQKLKMKCTVDLNKAEDIYPYAKEMLDAKIKEQLECDEEMELDENNADNIAAVTVENSEENNEPDNKAAIEEKEAIEMADSEITDKTTKIYITEKGHSLELDDSDLAKEIAEVIQNTSTENVDEIEHSENEKQKQTTSNDDEDTADVIDHDEDNKEAKATDGVESNEDKKENRDETNANGNTDNETTEENKTNGCTDEDKSTAERMETDENPPGTPTQDERMETDDKAEAPQHDNNETNNKVIEQNSETTPTPPSITLEDNLVKGAENPAEQDSNTKDMPCKPPEETSIENVAKEITANTETSEATNEPASTEELSTPPALQQDTNKTTLLHSVDDKLPSKEQTIAIPATETQAVALPTSSNGNV